MDENGEGAVGMAVEDVVPEDWDELRGWPGEAVKLWDEAGAWGDVNCVSMTDGSVSMVTGDGIDSSSAVAVVLVVIPPALATSSTNICRKTWREQSWSVMAFCKSLEKINVNWQSNQQCIRNKWVVLRTQEQKEEYWIDNTWGAKYQNPNRNWLFS